jgi:hypothetical protein
MFMKILRHFSFFFKIAATFFKMFCTSVLEHCRPEFIKFILVRNKLFEMRMSYYITFNWVLDSFLITQRIFRYSSMNGSMAAPKL